MLTSDKEVYYHLYCKQCEHESVDEGDEPCNTCLLYSSNVDSHKPVMFSGRTDSNPQKKQSLL